MQEYRLQEVTSPLGGGRAESRIITDWTYRFPQKNVAYVEPVFANEGQIEIVAVRNGPIFVVRPGKYAVATICLHHYCYKIQPQPFSLAYLSNQEFGEADITELKLSRIEISNWLDIETSNDVAKVETLDALPDLLERGTIQSETIQLKYRDLQAN